MNLPLHIARRYLFAKKSHNAINIISIISMVGVAIGTMALIVVLSVFNGFDILVKNLFNSFDPDIKIEAASGKVFSTDTLDMDGLKKIEGLETISYVLEENALLRYDDKQHIATIKGVDSNYVNVTGIDTMLIQGDFTLHGKSFANAVVGQGVAYYLGLGINFVTSLQVYVPRRQGRVSLNPSTAFRRNYAFPTGIFAIEQEVDSRFVLLPIDFVQDLLQYTNEVSALEIAVAKDKDIEEIQEQIRSLFGNNVVVKNRYQQKELFYKIMQAEKWAIFFILSFILMVASFNIIGSLTMLIIEKKNDIETLRNMGLTIAGLRRVFLFQGWMIAGIGALAGLFLGFIIAWAQQQFGIIQLQGSGSFVISQYPVDLKAMDFVWVFVTVVVIGLVTSWYPVRFITRNYITGQ